MKVNRQIIIALLLTILPGVVGAATTIMAQTTTAGTKSKVSSSIQSYGSEKVDHQIASAYAPIFYQSLGSQPRFDYITRFDFDGDWRGDNNWANAAETRFPLLAYVYYSVAETQTHYFVTYAVYHPRDYKGGDRQGAILSQAIERGVEALGRYDPTGLADEATLAHENDLEGVLVVAEKRGKGLADSPVQFVETLAHNRFLKYLPRNTSAEDGGEAVKIRGQRPELYIEPRGHGIRSNMAEKEQKSDRRILVYNYTGKPGDPTKPLNKSTIGYELTPLFSTLWSKALTGENPTYAATNDYGELLRTIRKGSDQSTSGTNDTGKLGSAFRGGIGGRNMARPPWGWFDSTERERPLGEWFFDPAGNIKRHFKLGESFSTKYIHAPTIGITRKRLNN